MKKLELLAPAGSLETLKAVIRAGADAVYLGGASFGARAYAKNFTDEEILEGIRYGHLHERKIILAVNTLLKERELEHALYEFLRPCYEEGIDAVIVQDLGVLDFIQSNFPGLQIHASTQMTVTNAAGAMLLKKMGLQRMVTAREMSLEEIRRIHKQVDIELESFVHGALCYCYSGQCLMSSMLGGRSGNRGRCAQPCRLPYQVNGRKTAPVLSLKDLCTLPFLYELADSGVYSFKIEGRMKSPEYAAGVVEIYRKYMDSYLEDSRIPVEQKDLEILLDLGNRSGFTRGYYQINREASMLSGSSASHAKRESPVLARIRQNYLEQELQEKITGKLTLQKGKPARLELSDGIRKVCCEGEVVQQAKSQPLSGRDVVERLKKTGNTPFVFASCTVKLEDDVFLPVKQLNQLRREALEELIEQILASDRRECPKRSPAPFPEQEKPAGQSQWETEAVGWPKVSASVEQREQLAAVQSSRAVGTVYIDCLNYDREGLVEQLTKDVFHLRAKGKKVFFILPHVFRDRTGQFYEGIFESLEALPLEGYVLRNLDELAFFTLTHPTGKKLIADSRLYTYSNRAKNLLHRLGIAVDTIPSELNQKEISHRKNRDSELVIYGRTELMVSAQCVQKNTAGCDGRPKLSRLTDRYQMQFPVRNYCAECYNVIYNSIPLCLLGETEAIRAVQPDSVRLCFTTESRSETEQILAMVENPPDEIGFAHTKGHWKRGVE